MNTNHPFNVERYIEMVVYDDSFKDVQTDDNRFTFESFQFILENENRNTSITTVVGSCYINSHILGRGLT